jgi:flagellin
MPSIINTNIASLNAQRNLTKSQGALTTSLQRLSTGLRINSAKDDAAGMAISSRFTSQISGLNVAARNANDGVSLAQTAEGALGQTTTSLQRIRELAVQSANATNSASDRVALNAEVQQLISEMDQIATQTDFNGNKILGTSGGFSATFQVGANIGQTISMTINSARTSDLGAASNFSDIESQTNTALATTLRNQFANAIDSTLNGVTLATVTAGSNSSATIASVNAATAQTGVTAFSYGNSLTGAAAAADGTTSAALVSGDIVVNGVSVGAVATNTLNGLQTAINAVSAQSGVTADTGVAGTSTMVLFNRSGSAISLSVNSANAATRSGFAQGISSVAAEDNGAVVLNAGLAGTTLTFGSATTGGALTGVSGTSASLDELKVSSLDITSVGGANLAILAVDNALTTVNGTRAQLGAVQNRFESTISNLTSTSENLSASRSRIQDADFAVETAALTRAQILQQAGTTILAQANSLPQSALSLLQ